MLWTIAVALAALWLLGMITSYTMGGVIHLLLVRRRWSSSCSGWSPDEGLSRERHHASPKETP